MEPWCLPGKSRKVMPFPEKGKTGLGAGQGIGGNIESSVLGM